MDIVYPVREDADNPELRHSLRSLVNLPHDTVWLAGYMPPWCTGVRHIPVPQTGTKWANAAGNWRAACLHPSVSERFILCNDDFFVMQPLDELPVLHQGAVEEVAKRYEQIGSKNYLAGMRATQRLLRRLGIDEPLSYDLHVPMALTKTGVLEAMSHDSGSLVMHTRTRYGNLAHIGGDRAEDVKALTMDDPGPDGPFLSTSDETWHGAAGRRIRAAFPDPSPYEI